VPITVDSGYVMDPHEALKRVDENTIGIYIIMGASSLSGWPLIKGSKV
jgi:hypothetical protein